MSEFIIELKDLTKTFGETKVLNKINLKIKKGDIYGVLGLSGAGKSTLVRCINGLEKYDEGEVLYNGVQATFDRKYKQEVSMIFQSFNLLEQRTVLKNVELAGKIAKIKNIHEKAINLLNKVGLKDKLNSYPSELSGGQKQRVAIARALMSDPKVLLCDEATSALDPDTTSSILKLLKELNEELNLTIVIISHQMSVIESICNKVAIIDSANIVEDGPLYDVFLSPKAEISKKLIYSGHLNTKFSDEKYIKLIFDGEIDSPIIANIIQDCNILISIVYADSKTIDGKIYGQMVIKLPSDYKDVVKLEKYLVIKNIKFEEILKDEIKK